MKRSFNIAMLTGIKRAITPSVTAARNRVIVDLCSELVSRGHNLTLFTTEDSFLPNVKIVGILRKGLSQLPIAENPFYQHTSYLVRMIGTLVKRQEEFDIVHNHMYPEFLPFLSSNSLSIPMLTTIHSQMTVEMKATLIEFEAQKFVAISNSAKKSSGLDIPVVHNGIDTDYFIPDEKKDREYMLFIGRMSKARNADGTFVDPKGVTTAIKVAESLGEKLKIVGNIEDPEFYETLIKPHLSEKIELVGGQSREQHLTREKIVNLYQGAKVFINPLNWEEPFGLVMAEAASCGVPVVAYERGSVRELVDDGKTGFIVSPDDGINGLINSVKNLESIDRSVCRKHAVDNFSKKHMADSYEVMYNNNIST